MKRIVLLPLALLTGVLGVAIMAQMAAATHPRPKAASPVRVSLVPAYEQCTAPNRTHGPPLAFPSCNPPAEALPSVTVGTPDANGAPANSSGYVQIKVIPHTCCPPEDLMVTASISDVRCKAGTSTCGNANATGGPDYTGELKVDSTIRISDHNSGPSYNEPATVVDIPLPINLSCFNTADTSIGATCQLGTQPVGVVPESSTPARAVVEMSQFRVDDGGPDGIVATTPNSLFMKQGIFIP